jgi:hypothetical protein
VCPTTDKRLSKIIMNWAPIEKRRKGSPRSWHDGVAIEMRARQLQVG